MLRFASILLGLLGAVLVLAGTASAAERDCPLWKKTGQWDVRIDQTLGYGCFAARTIGRTAFRIGFDRSRGGAYVIFGNKSWASIETGKDYDLVFQFDDEEPWRVPARGVSMGGDMNFLYFVFTEAGFIDEFRRQQKMHVFYEGDRILALPLTGSFEAIEEILNCQESVERTVGSSQDRDPFDGGSRSSDPFAD